MSAVDVLLWLCAAVAVICLVAILVGVALAFRFMRTGKKIAELIADDQEWARMQRRGPEDDR